MDAEVTYACPRCAASVTERFYGPCSSCRAELVAAVRGHERELTVDRFEPKMNVVPNHVATKE